MVLGHRDARCFFLDVGGAVELKHNLVSFEPRFEQGDVSLQLGFAALLQDLRVAVETNFGERLLAHQPLLRLGVARTALRLLRLAVHVQVETQRRLLRVVAPVEATNDFLFHLQN